MYLTDRVNTIPLVSPLQCSRWVTNVNPQTNAAVADQDRLKHPQRVGTSAFIDIDQQEASREWTLIGRQRLQYLQSADKSALDKRLAIRRRPRRTYGRYSPTRRVPIQPPQRRAASGPSDDPNLDVSRLCGQRNVQLEGYLLEGGGIHLQSILSPPRRLGSGRLPPLGFG